MSTEAVHIDTIIAVEAIRKQFPILGEQVYGKPLVYFDNAASTQKPIEVLDAEFNYYRTQYSNIHRGVHYLSQVGTQLYEDVREQIRQFVNAASSHEIIFTSGTTNGINLVARCFEPKYLKPGDEIIISGLEHHSNIVPWQMACERSGAKLKVIPLLDDGSISLDDFRQLLTEKTKLVAISYISNSLGTINPVQEIIALTHAAGAKVLIDAAQAIQHIVIDVQALDCDFLVASSHKIYGPTGTGFLYGKAALLDAMPPYEGGGDMIKTVTFEKTVYNELPFKFEAGTPNIAGVIGFGAALRFVQKLGVENIARHEAALLEKATDEITALGGIRFYGTAENKAAVLSFIPEGLHPYDVGVLLDQLGIAIRTGHHCTQPVMDRFGIPGTCRASFAVYNTTEEIDYFVSSLKRAIKMLR
jgi:cysteine desulfurase / selenocysteine lyase